MTYLNVFETIGGPSALTQEQGDLVFDEIMKAFSENTAITLDFSDVESMISAFLNRAIGRLYENYDGDYIKSNLTMKNFPKEKVSTLNIVIHNAKNYYANKDQFDRIAREVIDNE